MHAVGYEPNVAQTPQVILAMKVLGAMVPTAFFVLGTVIIFWYPISEAVHRVIREGVAAHGRGETVRDPLTNQLLAPPDPASEDEATGWLLDYFSLGELRRQVRQGSGRLIRDVTVKLVIAAAILAVSIIMGIRSLANVGEEAGLSSVLWIVTAGFALTALLFHALRIGPARRMATQPVNRDAIEIHLNNNSS
jgi:hypothetical protein